MKWGIVKIYLWFEGYFIKNIGLSERDVMIYKDIERLFKVLLFVYYILEFLNFVDFV